MTKISLPILASLILGLATFFSAPAHAASKITNVPARFERIQPGTIVIDTAARSLYFILGGGEAVKYPIAVPKRGKEWSGWTEIIRKQWKPDWVAPADVAHDHPELAGRVIPGGAPNNPMGTAALLMGAENGQVAIHGTTQKMRSSIGTAASYGCIRMLNEDVADLFQRVSEGTPVLKTN